MCARNQDYIRQPNAVLKLTVEDAPNEGRPALSANPGKGLASTDYSIGRRSIIPPSIRQCSVTSHSRPQLKTQSHSPSNPKSGTSRPAQIAKLPQHDELDHQHQRSRRTVSEHDEQPTAFPRCCFHHVSAFDFFRVRVFPSHPSTPAHPIVHVCWNMHRKIKSSIASSSSTERSLQRSDQRSHRPIARRYVY